MKDNNLIIKFFVILTMVFIFTNNAMAGTEGEKCIDIKRTTEGNASHFDVKGLTCTWDKFIGWKNYDLGSHYPSKEEAEQKGYEVTQEQLNKLKNTLSIEEYEKLLGSDSLQSIRCNSPMANIETRYSCSGSWGAANGCDQTMKTVYRTVCNSEGYNCQTVEDKECEKYKMICKCGYNQKIEVFDGCCRIDCPEDCSLPVYAKDLGNTDKSVLGAFYDGKMTPETRVDGLLVRATDVNWVSGNNKIRVDVFKSLGDLNGDVFHNFYKVDYVAYTAENVQSDCESFGGGYANFKSCGCNTTYTLKCPIFSCDPKEETSGVCTPEYIAESLKADMYAVNPAMNFTLRTESGGLGYSKVESYEIDDSFDYRTCNTSYQSEECGYSNILIESEYLNKNDNNVKDLLDYQTINLALRLYGGHVSSRGYIELAGLGNTRTRPGTDEACTYDVVYTFIPSTYKISNKYIMEYFNYVTENYSSANQSYPYGDYVSPAAFVNDNKLTFPCEHLGAICHVPTSKEIRVRKVRLAVGLFFNTIMGNSKMKEHRDLLFGYSLNKPQEAELISDGKDESRIVVNYGNINVDTLETGVIYNCDNLAGLDRDLADYIKKYCSIKIVYNYIENGVLMHKDTVPEYCSGKHALRCTTKKMKVAVCDHYQETQTVTYDYSDVEGTKTNGGPVKMIACNNSDRLTTLYGIVGSDKIKEESKTYTYTISSWECGNTKCDKTFLRKKDASAIPPSTKEEYDAKPENDVSKGFVKDPSLKCILNTTAEKKLKYDFSELFGVNTNFCRVYCSDEAIYYIPDRVNIKDGLSLKYDIAVRSYLKDPKSHLISSVVKEKRTCVSEIYYNSFPRTINWATIYGFSLKHQGDVLGGTKDEKNNYVSVNPIRNWEELYKVLKAVKGSSTKNNDNSSTSGKTVTENLNEIIYDLYNCNFFTAKGDSNMFKDNNITRPRQRAFGGNELNQNVYDNYIAKEFNISNTYGLHGGYNTNNEKCNYNKDTGKLDCMEMKYISYKAGSEMVDGSRIGGTGTNNNIDLENVSTGTLSKVEYCRNAEAKGGACFGYEETWNPEESTKLNEDDLNSYNYERMDGKTKVYEIDSKREAQVPINDYALFTVTTEVGFYNNTLFQPEPSTGKVSKVSGSSNSNRLTLDKYSYPISKDAFALCSYEYGQDDRNIIEEPNWYYNSTQGFYKPQEYNNCSVTHQYSSLNTYHRLQFDDDFYKEISTYTAKSYYEVTGSQSQCPPGSKVCLQGANDIGEYRNVDRSNLFPHQENAALSSTETNWDTQEGQVAIKVIEETDTDVFVNDEAVQYSFTLTPRQIKNIRSYNRTASDYVDVEVDDCYLDERGIYLNCKIGEESILNDIRNNQGNALTNYADVVNGKDGTNIVFELPDEG